VSGIHGNVTKDSIANLKCSPAAPCKHLKFENLDVRINGTQARPDKYGCLAVEESQGWACTHNIPLGD
jgi:hypothetical protein